MAVRAAQKAFEAHALNVPKLALKKILERKLWESGIPLNKEGVSAFLDHLMSGAANEFTWDDGSPETNGSTYNIHITEEDISEAYLITTEFLARLPKLIQSTVDKGSKSLVDDLWERWALEGALQEAEADQFCQNLHERWGEGLALLRMLLTICREMGSNELKRTRRLKSKRHLHRRFVLFRLHSRACQVSEEIITLLENGLADGAMARWRTLHEIAVISTVIETGDEELAERYILHNAVDIRREAYEYTASLVPMDYPPIAKAKAAGIERSYNNLLKRFGKEFGKEYGWAAARVEGQLNFRSLQEEAGRAGMGSHYKMASYNVHAGARSLFHRLSNFEDSDVLIAGRSNVGLLEPGQNTAFTLVQITSSAIPMKNDLDGLIQRAALVNIRDRIPKAFAKADRKLRKDEMKLRSELKKKS